MNKFLLVISIFNAICLMPAFNELQDNATKLVALEYPAYLCQLALKDGLVDIAEYLGEKNFRPQWEKVVLTICNKFDNLSVKPELVIIAEAEPKKILRNHLIEHANSDRRIDVVQFIQSSI